MAHITADARTVHQALHKLEPGDILTLQPGTYARPLAIVGRRGREEQPIVIRGTPGVIFDGGRSAADWREEGNRRSIEGDRQGYPGLWPFIDEAMITLRRCAHVVLEGFAVRRCWPTAIFIQDSRATTIRDLEMEDATFAIGAKGARTYGITIERVHWCQDVTRELLWRWIPWAAVHEDRGVDVENDWRLFDGDFFRSAGIAGGVTIRHCEVEHAFNAVHGYNPARDPALSRDFAVHDCRFSFIRDNVFEPEDVAQNWWFYRNRIVNCHKWFSIEAAASRFVYIFANLGWFTERPGRPGQGNRSGSVFKLGDRPHQDAGHHYVFNNSFALRSDYMRQGTLRGLRHWANAVRSCKAGEGICEGGAAFFGNLAADPVKAEERFTTEWRRWDIAFGDDIIAHPHYKTELERAGYGPFADGLACDPGFRDPIDPGSDGEGLKLTDGPSRTAASRQAVMMPDGNSAELPAGRDRGAFQGEDLLRWREFEPMPTPSS